MSFSSIIKILPTRVYRVYKGGALLDLFRGEKEPKDTNYPEDWICSTVRALQPYGVSDESISKIEPIEERKNIEELIDIYPAEILGERHIGVYGNKLNILVKLLDSAIRLPLQCHPERSFSKKYLNASFGKAEAWFIVGTRKVSSEDPYILLGFREKVDKKKLMSLIEKDDSDALVALMNKIKVSPYDTYFIAPGLPHAIGEGVFMVETQEPSDFTFSLERRCGDIVSTDQKCTLNLGWDLSLDAYDYTPYSELDVREKFGMKKELISRTDKGKVYNLNGGSYMKSCFEILFLEGVREATLSFKSFASVVILNGEGCIARGRDEYPIKRGETYLLPFNFGEHRYIGEEPLDIVISLPPNI